VREEGKTMEDKEGAIRLSVGDISIDEYGRTRVKHPGKVIKHRVRLANMHS
jgi:hypothetical protein